MREMLAAAAEAQPSSSSAHALTESYVRLRAEALRIVEENNLPEEEFINTFPEMEMAPFPDPSERPPVRRTQRRSGCRARSLC
jgi:hypothetical protein